MQGNFRFVWSLFTLFCFGTGQTWGQALKVVPPNFTMEDDVTIIFDASQGNQRLMGYQGAVYAHTGVITGTPENPSDWKYIQGDWGKRDPRLRMTYIGDNRYQLRLNVRRFYGLAKNEPILQLAFVFRDQSGALVAKDQDDRDLYFPPLSVRDESLATQTSMADFPGLGKAIEISQTANGSLCMTDGQAQICFQSYGPGKLHLQYLAKASDQSLPSKSITARPTEIKYEESEGGLKIWMDEGHHLQVELDPIRWSIFRGDTLIFSTENGFVFDPAHRQTGLRFHLKPKERLYGGGSRALPLNRRGYRLNLYHRPAYGYQDGAEDLYLSLPYFQSSQGYAIMLDSYRRGYADLGGMQGDLVELTVEDDQLSCFIITGKPSELSTKYAELTGFQPLPPRWALGYLQSRFGYQSQRETQEIGLLTREAGLGLDGIALDAYWFGGPSQMGDLSWTPGQWPNPAQMMQRFSGLGIATLPIIEPYITLQSSHFESLSSSGLLAKDLEGRTYVIEDFWAGPAGLIDVFEPKARDFVWQKVKSLLDQGATGVWSDLIEPENHPTGIRHRPGLAATVHNLYPLTWSAFLYDRFRETYPEQRWFNLVRSGHLGMQRYATFPWTGDVSRTWSGLQAQPKAILGAGLSGLAYLHSDLGGFTGLSRDEELYRRWVQFGVFSPIMRVHGNTEDFEPEPIFHDARTQNVVRKAIQLRYQMYPYLNTLAWETHIKAWPWLRPTFFHYPTDSTTFELDAQYLFGKDLLVVPILAPGQQGVTVYLPIGDWYDFFNGEKYQGGHWYRMPVSEDHLPVFAKAGSIIPQGRGGRNLKTWTADTLSWTCYLPTSRLASSYGHTYLDDGTSFGVKGKNEYRHLEWRGDWEKQKLWLRLSVEGGGFSNEPRVVHHQLRIKGLTSSPKLIKHGRKKLKEGDWQWHQGELHINLDLGMMESELQVVFRKN